jgi:hypothetical protein
MRASRLWSAVLIALGGPWAWGEGSADLAKRLDAFRSPGPIAATLRLELRQERTTHHKTSTGEAALSVELDQGPTSLGVRWDASALANASEEERKHDRSPDGLTPIRDAMKELDPARLSHLLDQTATLVGLTSDAPVEEGEGTWEAGLRLFTAAIVDGGLLREPPRGSHHALDRRRRHASRQRVRGQVRRQDEPRLRTVQGVHSAANPLHLRWRTPASC